MKGHLFFDNNFPGCESSYELSEFVMQKPKTSSIHCFSPMYRQLFKKSEITFFKWNTQNKGY